MNEQACVQCQSPDSNLSCGTCQAVLCKSCARLLGDENFALLPQRPATIIHDSFCEPCYQASVAPLVEAYEDAAARARDVNIFYKSQGKETRFIRRTEKLLRVEECLDRSEAILKLAFLAASTGYNTLVDVEVEPRKIRNGGWQSSRWGGRAVPTTVDDEQLSRRFLHAPN